MIVTYSSLSCFLACRKKYKLRYVDCIVPKEQPVALLFGTQVHSILERVFNQIKADQAFKGGDTLLEEIERVAVESIPDKVESTERSKLIGLVLGYLRRWYNDDINEYDVVAVEHEFKISISNDVCFVGKIDGILRRRSDNKYFILEHKTASRVDSEYAEQKEIDGQTVAYAYAAERELGIKISGVIHDIIIKQQIRLKKGESQEEFCDRLINTVTDDNFVRIFTEVNSEKLEEFTEDLMSGVKDLSCCSHFYKCTGNCLGKFGACEYLPICRGTNCSNDFTFKKAHNEISDITLNKEESN